MPTQNDFVDPLNPTGDQGALREALTIRAPYVLASSEDPTDFVATDPDSGAVTRALVFNGQLFYLNPADTTTAHDGISVLVSNDGKRYFRDGTPGVPYSVLSRDENEPPGGESLGDAYLVPDAPTGDWSAHAKAIAVLTARGWEYIAPRVGQLLFVEDEALWVHYSAAGSWVVGFGSVPVSDDSVLPASRLGGKTHWIVESVENTPPDLDLVADGVSFIIGPAPTDEWAGHAGKLAMARGDDWIIVAPTEGYTAYDQDAGGVFIFNGAEWAAPGTANVQFFDASGTWNKPGGFPDDAAVLVEAIPGGGSGASRSSTGNAAGGAGGSLHAVWLRLSHFDDTATVTIGGDAAGVTGNTNGNAGSNVSVALDNTTLTFPGPPAADNRNASNSADDAIAVSTGPVAPLGRGGDGGSLSSANVRTAGGNGDGLGAPGGGPAGGSSGSNDGGVSPITGAEGGNGNNSGDGVDGVGYGAGGGASVGGASGKGKSGFIRITVFG